MAPIGNDAVVMLDLDFVLAFGFMPFCRKDFVVQLHIFAQIVSLAKIKEVLVYLGGMLDIVEMLTQFKPTFQDHARTA